MLQESIKTFITPCIKTFTVGFPDNYTNGKIMYEMHHAAFNQGRDLTSITCFHASMANRDLKPRCYYTTSTKGISEQ